MRAWLLPEPTPWRRNSRRGSRGDCARRCGGVITSSEGSRRRQAAAGRGGAAGAQAPLPAPCARRIAPHSSPRTPPADPCASHAFPPPPPPLLARAQGFFRPSRPILRGAQGAPTAPQRPGPRSPVHRPAHRPRRPPACLGPSGGRRRRHTAPRLADAALACGACRPLLGGGTGEEEPAHGPRRPDDPPPRPRRRPPHSPHSPPLSHRSNPPLHPSHSPQPLFSSSTRHRGLSPPPTPSPTPPSRARTVFFGLLCFFYNTITNPVIFRGTARATSARVTRLAGPWGVAGPQTAA